MFLPLSGYLHCIYATDRPKPSKTQRGGIYIIGGNFQKNNRVSTQLKKSRVQTG